MPRIFSSIQFHSRSSLCCLPIVFPSATWHNHTWAGEATLTWLYRLICSAGSVSSLKICNKVFLCVWVMKQTDVVICFWWRSFPFRIKGGSGADIPTPSLNCAWAVSQLPPERQTHNPSSHHKLTFTHMLLLTRLTASLYWNRKSLTKGKPAVFSTQLFFSVYLSPVCERV